MFHTYTHRFVRCSTCVYTSLSQVFHSGVHTGLSQVFHTGVWRFVKSVHTGWSEAFHSGVHIGWPRVFLTGLYEVFHTGVHTGLSQVFHTGVTELLDVTHLPVTLEDTDGVGRCRARCQRLPEQNTLGSITLLILSHINRESHNTVTQIDSDSDIDRVPLTIFPFDRPGLYFIICHYLVPL